MGFEEKQRDHRPVYFLAIVGYGCLCGWELTVMFSPVLPLTNFTSLQNAVLLYIVLITCSLLTVIFVWRYSSALFPKSSRFFPICSVLSFIAIIFSGIAHVFPYIPFAFAIASWALLGIGQAALIVYWGVLLSLIPSQRTIFSTALASVTGTILFVLLSSIQNLLINLLGLAFFLIVTLACGLFLSSYLSEQKVEPKPSYREDPPLSRPSVFSAVLHSLIYGFTLVALFSFGYLAAIAGAASGIFGGLLAMFIGSSKSHAVLNSTTIQFITIPFIVMGLLLIPLLDDPGKIACLCLVNTAHAFYRTASVGTLATTGADYGLHPLRFASLGRIPTFAGILAGVIMGYLVFFVWHLSGYSFELLITLSVIAIVFSTSVYVLKGLNNSSKIQGNMIIDDPEESAVSDGTQILESRINEIAQKFNLSPRETEVFALLARGRNAEYIQKALVLAPGTVKTHIYHVYQKTGVGSQQRLMDLVELKVS